MLMVDAEHWQDLTSPLPICMLLDSTPVWKWALDEKPKVVQPSSIVRNNSMNVSVFMKNTFDLQYGLKCI